MAITSSSCVKVQYNNSCTESTTVTATSYSETRLYDDPN